jgi:hypothetical protein
LVKREPPICLWSIPLLGVKVFVPPSSHPLSGTRVSLRGKLIGEWAKAFVVLFAFVVSHPSNIDVFPLKREELQEYILVSLFRGGDIFPYLVVILIIVLSSCSSFRFTHLVALLVNPYLLNP